MNRKKKTSKRFRIIGSILLLSLLLGRLLPVVPVLADVAPENRVAAVTEPVEMKGTAQEKEKQAKGLVLQTEHFKEGLLPWSAGGIGVKCWGMLVLFVGLNVVLLAKDSKNQKQAGS